MTKIGFTGTHRGMTKEQRATLAGLLYSYVKGSTVADSATEFHHGDCIGADAEAHDLAYMLGLEIFIHPPIKEDSRAWKAVDALHMADPLPYLERNMVIVARTDFLVAAPDSRKEKLRSGTWSTVRRARWVNKPAYLIYPDGTLQKDPRWSFMR
jgi:hypothetical protein